MRALLKLSGQVLKGGSTDVINREYLWQLAEVLKQAQVDGHQLAIVIGGGNLFRFDKNRMDPRDANLNRTLGDGRGLLATLFNGLWLQDILLALGAKSELFTAVFSDAQFVQPLNEVAAQQKLDSGSIVILAGGTGKPGFSTDTGSAQLAHNLKIPVILKATHTVDGVYTADPAKDPTATKLDRLTYDRAIGDGLTIMDSEALKQANEAGLTTIVFSIREPATLTKLLAGETIGSVITK